MLVVLTTTPTLQQADALAEKLVLEKLAACVQVLPQMHSIYFWQGEIKTPQTVTAKIDAVYSHLNEKIQ